MKLGKRCAAELIGTFWLVFGGCGSAVLDAAFPNLGIGLLGVAFAFGLTVLTMAFAIGHISGCHLNPAVTVGLVTGNRFKAGEIVPYVIAQSSAALPAQRYCMSSLRAKQASPWQTDSPRTDMASTRLEAIRSSRDLSRKSF